LHVGNQSETHREIPVEIAEGLVRSLADVEPTLSAYTSSPTGKKEARERERERERRERRRDIYMDTEASAPRSAHQIGLPSINRSAHARERALDGTKVN
jgi:hypothetical protein